MTIVAAIRREKDTFIVSDSLLTASGYEVCGGEKYRRIGDAYVGISGDVTEWPTDISDLNAVLVSMTAKGDDCVALSVQPEGSIHIYENGERIDIASPFVAIGSGGACAMGALAVANEAIQKASAGKATELITSAVGHAADVAEGCGGNIHIARITHT